jgi:hypothetical protein
MQYKKLTIHEWTILETAIYGAIHDKERMLPLFSGDTEDGVYLTKRYSDDILELKNVLAKLRDLEFDLERPVPLRDVDPIFTV